MTYLSDRKVRILRALRSERLNPYQIADKIEEPIQAVRDELRFLRGRGLVRSRLQPREAVLWELTPAGQLRLNKIDQIELEIGILERDGLR